MARPIPLARTGTALAVLWLAGCQSGGDVFLTAYSGAYTDASLPEDIVFLKDVELEDAQLVAVALSQVLGEPTTPYRWEVEGNVAHWFGDQDHTELNGLIVLRHTELPWDPWLDTSFAFGNGLSLASSIPDLEERFHPDTGSTRLLYHIAVEIEVALPGLAGWWSLLRVHHRSGVFGTFSDVDGGSNAITLGLRCKL